jgi:hypothetical protein
VVKSEVRELLKVHFMSEKGFMSSLTGHGEPPTTSRHGGQFAHPYAI